MTAGCEVDDRTRPLDAHDNVENGSVADRGQRPRGLRAVHNHSVAPTEGPKHGERYDSSESHSGGDRTASPLLLSLRRLRIAKYRGPAAGLGWSGRVCVIEKFSDV